MATDRTHEEVLREMEQDVSDLMEKLDEFPHAVRKARKAEFLAAGGCVRCGGRGWVVTWDTMDSMSGCYAEYGTCEDCKGAKRTGAAAMDTSYYGKYDRNRGVPCVTPMMTTEESRTFGELTTALTMATTARDSLKAAMDPYVKGRVVRVYKGRKVPVGTVGTVFWLGEKVNNFGYRPTMEKRLGLKDADGNVHWTAASNCEAVLTTF